MSPLCGFVAYYLFFVKLINFIIIKFSNCLFIKYLQILTVKLSIVFKENLRQKIKRIYIAHIILTKQAEASTYIYGSLI